MIKIVNHSTGITLNELEYPKNSLSFNIASKNRVQILTLEGETLFDEIYTDFRNSTNQNYATIEDVISDLKNSYTSQSGSGGSSGAIQTENLVDSKISALQAATAVDGTELIPVVQSGTTKKSTLNVILIWLTTQLSSLFLLKSTYDPAGSAAQAVVRDISITLAAAQANALAETGIILGQRYDVSDIGATHAGYSHLILTGALVINAGGDTVLGYSTKAKIYINALKKEVDCDFDVISDKLYGKLILWAGRITDAVINIELISVFGFGVVSIAENGAGDYHLTLPTSIVTANNLAKYSALVDYENAYYTDYFSDTVVKIFSATIPLGFTNGITSNSYVEVAITL